jgi:hypothetical protein
MASPTLRELTGMNPNPSPISMSALVLIDCQQTYREGIMQLVGVEPALKEAASLLKRFRAAGRPVIHIMHDAGPGTPYDVSAPIDLEKGVFTLKDPKEIAVSLKHSAEASERRKSDPYRSAMSMLNFYINRAGKNLSDADRNRLEKAKGELRKLFHREPAKPAR